jgi:nucleoid-associated protein YgaU
MGVFDFIKAAGERLGIGGAPATSESKEVTPPPTAEQVQALVAKLNLAVEDIQVKLNGDTVEVSGAAASNEAREKAILAAGNIAGVARVSESITTPDGAAASTFYTVVKGDTLWKIAESHYGKGKGGKYTVIFEANKPMLKDPDKIYPGQNLRIPPL